MEERHRLLHGMGGLQRPRETQAEGLLLPAQPDDKNREEKKMRDKDRYRHKEIQRQQTLPGYQLAESERRRETERQRQRDRDSQAPSRQTAVDCPEWGRAGISLSPKERAAATAATSIHREMAAGECGRQSERGPCLMKPSVSHTYRGREERKRVGKRGEDGYLKRPEESDLTTSLLLSLSPPW